MNPTQGNRLFIQPKRYQQFKVHAIASASTDTVPTHFAVFRIFEPSFTT